MNAIVAIFAKLMFPITQFMKLIISHLCVYVCTVHSMLIISKFNQTRTNPTHCTSTSTHTNTHDVYKIAVFVYGAYWRYVCVQFAQRGCCLYFEYVSVCVCALVEITVAPWQISWRCWQSGRQKAFLKLAMHTQNYGINKHM